MLKTRLLLGLSLGALLAQSAWANTVWLKDPFAASGVCKNTLSTNPGKVIGYGGIDDSNTFTMTISNPKDGMVYTTPGVPVPARSICTYLPKTSPSTDPVPTTIVFSGTLPAQHSTINMIKPGTKGQDECLRQGSNLTGIGAPPPTGSSITSGTYTLTLNYSFTADGCVPGTTPPQPIGDGGQPSFLRGAKLTGGTGYGSANFNGGYYVFNPDAVHPGAVPEPGSLALLLAGASAAAMLSWARRRRAARVSA